MNRPFVILALPRSRTAWLSRYLTYGDWSCGHDEIRHLRSVEDVKSWFTQPNTGTVETAAAPWWRLLLKYAPSARVVTIRRQPEDVLASLERQSLPLDGQRLREAITRLDRKLDQIEARLPDVLSVSFDDLGTEAGCARIFEYCLPYAHDHAWWETVAAHNIQINLTVMLRYMIAYAPQMATLAKIAKAETVALMNRRHVVVDGVTFQQERFDDFYRDGQRLFPKHLAAVGEPDAPKDAELARVMDELGGLHITTARSNGRMFGYTMSIIGPSLEEPGVLAALNMTTYASPDIPGLGIKLHRAANEQLRARGVAGVAYDVGNLPKMAAFFRRLGARSCGERYLLGLN